MRVAGAVEKSSRVGPHEGGVALNSAAAAFDEPVKQNRRGAWVFRSGAWRTADLTPERVDLSFPKIPSGLERFPAELNRGFPIVRE
jgi:hypothetical protein